VTEASEKGKLTVKQIVKKFITGKTQVYDIQKPSLKKKAQAKL
jgi:hypothetical protein